MVGALLCLLPPLPPPFLLPAHWARAILRETRAPFSVQEPCVPTPPCRWIKSAWTQACVLPGNQFICSLAWLAARTTRPLLALEMLHAAAGLLPPLPTSTPAPSSVGRAGSAQLVQVGQRAADGLCRRGGGGRRRCALAAAHGDECSPHSGHAGGWRCLIVDGCTLLRPALQPLRIHVPACLHA